MRRVAPVQAMPASLDGVAARGVVANLDDLLCSAFLPAIFTAVLTQQSLSPAAHYGYIGLYIVGYLTDDTLMVAAAVAALGSRKLDQGAGRVLKLVSGLVMLALGALLLLRPQWLFQAP